MRALITGATGFIGSRFTRKLIELGHGVSIVTRESSNLGQFDDLRTELDVHVIDEHPDSLRRAVTGSRPDVVFHLATYYARDHRPTDIAPMLEANIAFPLRLVDAMAREGVRNFIDTASAWQFYESAGYRPVCLHSATKAAFEALLAYFIDSGSIGCITLVMHDSYGPGDLRRKIFNVVREHAGRTDPLPMSGGEQLIDLIHIDDAVAAYIAAAERLCGPDMRAEHEVYSISGGSPLPLRQVVEKYVRYAELDVPIEWGGRSYHAREVMVPWGHGAQLPGWRPQIDIETGLRELARADRR